MIYYLITCKSLTYAQKASRALEKAGITATITRPPRGLTQEGCAYSIKVSEKKLSQSLVVLKGAGIGYKKVFKLHADGTASEVEI